MKMFFVRFLRCIATFGILASNLSTNAAAQVGANVGVRVALPSPIEVEVRVKDHPRSFVAVDAVFFSPPSGANEAILGITVKTAPGLLAFTSVEVCIIEDDQQKQDRRIFDVTVHAMKGQPALLFMPADNEFTTKLVNIIKKLEARPGMFDDDPTIPRVLVVLRNVNIK